MRNKSTCIEGMYRSRMFYYSRYVLPFPIKSTAIIAFISTAHTAFFCLDISLLAFKKTPTAQYSIVNQQTN